ncbi:MAG: type II toxin-antitoxin system VapC family toxin [Chloroflexi bacterium]|nr:type II toxin-antitoxin system VapC family toxin [Chloroflexota bacterium]
MPARVVDASVMAAWCFREPRAQEALRLIGDAELYAPLLLAYELASIARRKAVAYPEKLRVLGDALRTALLLPIHWMDVDHVSVLGLAMTTNLTTYDASYLYVARVLGVPLVTFDERLARAAGEAAG